MLSVILLSTRVDVLFKMFP